MRKKCVPEKKISNIHVPTYSAMVSDHLKCRESAADESFLLLKFMLQDSALYVLFCKVQVTTKISY